MSALKQNPFLVGFAVVMVLGVGALGYLTYSAADAHSAAATKYEDQARELNRLQTSKPFPSTENLQKFVEQKKSFQEKVNALQEKLASIKIKVEDISPTGFQDKLRDTVARIATRATEANVTLPTEDKQKFYLGFNIYQGEPPKAAAAPRLYRDLRAIESVLNAIIETKNVAIKELKREPLKEEQDPKPAAPEKGKNKPGGKATEPTESLIQKSTFTLKFSTTQENFQRILTSIVTSKEQFFIPRYVTVKNEQPEPPPKIAVAAAAPQPVPADLAAAAANPAANPAAAPAAGAPAAPAPDKPQLQYIFGRETVEVTLDLEIVDVPAPAAPDADKTANNRK